MRKLLFTIFLLISFAVLYAQPNTFVVGEDILSKYGNGYSVSDEDSVFFSDDTLWLCGAETLDVYVNVGRTNGMLCWKGTVTSVDTLFYGGDTIAFIGDSGAVQYEVALHNGDGSAANANIAETFYYMDSVNVDTASINSVQGSFYVRPFDSSDLDQIGTIFWTFRIRGWTGAVVGIWIREERIFAY